MTETGNVPWIRFEYSFYVLIVCEFMSIYLSFLLRETLFKGTIIIKTNFQISAIFYSIKIGGDFAHK